VSHPENIQQYLADFLVAASASRGPGSGGHASGTLDRANELLAAHPSIAGNTIYAAAVLGDETAIRHFISVDKGNATIKGGPYEWDALTWLCFSKYLRLDPARSDAFIRSAAALLEAGADANTGFYEDPHLPKPEWESVLYGAAGVAHHGGVTQLLLQNGADPNDGEVTYHTPETRDNEALQAILATGKLTEDSLAIMLLRKSDWHDEDGMRLLLEKGADPNRMTLWGYTALHQSLRRDNGAGMVEKLLDHGGDPALESQREHRSALSVAIRRGRRDVLELFQRKGIPIDVSGVERLIAACALDDKTAIAALAISEPALVKELLAEGGTLLAEFAGNANATGVANLLDLGVPVTASYMHGDGYFGIPWGSTALHVAAWKAWPSVVKVLLERGAPVNAEDGAGRTPLYYAVQACINSYWTYRRNPDSIKALLEAGASIPAAAVEVPTGYAAADDLLLRYRD